MQKKQYLYNFSCSTKIQYLASLTTRYFQLFPSFEPQCRNWWVWWNWILSWTTWWLESLICRMIFMRLNYVNSLSCLWAGCCVQVFILSLESKINRCTITEGKFCWFQFTVTTLSNQVLQCKCNLMLHTITLEQWLCLFKLASSNTFCNAAGEQFFS